MASIYLDFPKNLSARYVEIHTTASESWISWPPDSVLGDWERRDRGLTGERWRGKIISQFMPRGHLSAESSR